MLLFYVKFHAQNICQMRKTRIEVKANIITYADACEVVRLVANDWHTMTINMANKNDETIINFVNVNLVEFKVHIKTLLANSI